MKFVQRLTFGMCVFAIYALPLSQALAGNSETANQQTRSFIQNAMREQRIPGLQIAVIRHQQVVLSENFGMANVENQIPVTSTTLFPINSATKALTGVAVMQLLASGQIDLHAPISRYLSDLPDAWQQIRVHQLLSHTSGLPDIVDDNGDLISKVSEAQAWEMVKKMPVRTKPGLQFAYNQTNYGLLARIIEKQSHLPYSEYVARHQLLPAKMALSTFGDSYDLIPNAATIYATSPRGSLAPNDKQRLSKWIYQISYSLWAGGGLQTNASELARWILALSNGQLISREHLQMMWTPETLIDGNDGDWGSGWPVLQKAPHRLVAGIGGARAAFFIYPDDALAIIVLTNLAGANPQRFIPAIASFYLKPASETP